MARLNKRFRAIKKNKIELSKLTYPLTNTKLSW